MQLKEIEKLAASVMEKAVDAKEVAGVNLLVLKAKRLYCHFMQATLIWKIRF